MAKEWVVHCKDCGEEFGYSDWSHQAGAARGQSRPERCPNCRKKHNRQTALMGLAYFDLKPRSRADTAKVSPGSLGSLSHPAREHHAMELPSGFDPTKFGVTDDDIRAVFDWLSDPKHQVAVVVGPTGSGKSTALPYRLIHPPEGIDEDQFTRYGQVLITQPRIQATRNIPAYVAKDLYGSSIGSGFDVGFRYKNNPYSDWRNRLVYATDGTLINWIVGGQIANLSVIMIDEAHERSLNIDLILGLLKKLLPRYPHLKLIVASATIDSGLFINYFGPDTAKLIEFQGKRKFKVETFFMEESSALLYDALPKLLRNIPAEVASKVVWLLAEIAAEHKPTGDILAFLQGEKPIEQAVGAIRQAVKGNAKLSNVDVYPLYTTLPQEEQNKALLKKPDPTRRRVVVTTNVAETSLTVEDIVYVVDSGLINEARWNPDSQTKQVLAVLHSQAGCKQRWGRGGRLRDGQAYCLYTENQFTTLFPEYTVPQIQRSDLEPVILAAKAAGIDDLTKFDWIQSPPIEELERAPRALKQIGALDEDGYLTEHGLELQSFGEEPAMAHLMATADRYACAIEVATLLPMLKLGGPRYLLRTDRKWDATTRRAVEAIHQGLKKGCKDDLEFCLKLYTAWSEGQWDGYSLAPLWAVRREWPRFIPQFSREMKEKLGDREKPFREALVGVYTFEDLSGILAEFGMEEVGGPWLSNAQVAFRKAERAAWGRAFFVNDSLFRDKIEPERNTLLDSLSGHKKEEERRPIDFDLLDRVRILMACALPDRAYELVADPSSVPTDVSTGPTPTSYRSRSPRVSPPDSQDQSRPIIQINSDSACYGQCPDAFVCAKQQVIVHPIQPSGPPVPVMHVSYLSLVNPEWFDDIERARGSALAMGRLLAARTRDPGTGFVFSTSTPKRLLLDQVFPIGSRYECVGIRESPEGSIQVQLLRLVREQREVAESFIGDEPETNVLADDADATEAGELVDTVLTAEDVLIQNPDEDIVQPWEDLADDAPMMDARSRDAGDTDRPVSELVLRRARAAASGDGFGSGTWPEGPLCQLLQPDADCKIGLPLLVEVVDYSFGAEQPTILVRPVPDRDPFDLFAEHFHLNDEISVVAVDYDQRPNDSLVSLVVREPISGLELLLGPENISFGSRGFAVKEIPPGTQLQVVIEGMDHARQRVHLSGLPALEKQLDEKIRLQRSKTGTYEVDGIVKEMTQERVHFLVGWSELERGLIHVASVSGNGLHKKSADAYQLGEACRLSLRFSDRASHVRLDDLPEVIKPLLGIQGAFKNLSWEPGILYFQGRMTYATRDELHRASDNSKYRRAVNDLYRFSNQFWASTLDADWGPRVAKYHVGDRVEGQVSEVVSFGAFVELEPGIRGLVHIRNLSWGFVKDPGTIIQVGQRVKAQILEIDVEQRRLSLTMKIPENDPFARYKIGDHAKGQVTGVKDYGAFVEVEPGVGGLIHVSQMSRRVDVGDQVEVAIIAVDSEKKRHNYRLVSKLASPLTGADAQLPALPHTASQPSTPPQQVSSPVKAEASTPSTPALPQVPIRPTTPSTPAPPLTRAKASVPPVPAIPTQPRLYREELRVSLSALPKLQRKPSGFFASLFGSGTAPIDEIKRATGTDIQIDSSAGNLVITGRSQEAVQRALQQIKAALS